MKYTKLLLFILCFIFGCKTENSPNLVIVSAFVDEVLNTNAKFETILTKYICINSDKGDSVNRKENMETLIMLLKVMRKQFNSTSWTVKKYLDLPSKFQTIQISNDKERFIYAVIFKDKNISPWYILVANGKIASFITMSKDSEMRYFLSYCL